MTTATALGAALLWGGCEEDKADTGRKGVLPDSAAPDVVEDSGPGSFPVDTFADSGFVIEPTSTLSITHVGAWQQSPEGGPYAEMTGELVIEELLDGDPGQPWCRATLSLSGPALPGGQGCEGCDASYAISFLLLSEGPTLEEAESGLVVGGLDACISPDLPLPGEVWGMGWSDVESTVYFDYYGSGVWLPWYAGEQSLDRVDFSWLSSIGFHRPEEEDR